MIIRPTGRRAGIPAARSRAANTGAGTPIAVRIAATVVAAGLLLTGCGSIAASSGPGGPGSHAVESAGQRNGSAGSAMAGRAARQVKTSAASVLCRNLMVPLSVRIVRIGGSLVRPGSGGVGGVTGQGAGGVVESVSVTGTIARSVAAAACALPVLTVITGCPPALQYHHLYQLTFTVAGRALPVVIVRAASCPQVTGLGPMRWMPPRESFLAELGRVAEPSRPVLPVKLPLTGKPIHRLSPVANMSH
jgi:hypothetical protein